MLYFGDGMRSDMSGAKKYAKWDTVYIYEEMIAERRDVVMADCLGNTAESLATNGSKVVTCDDVTDDKNSEDGDDEPVAKRKKSDQTIEKTSLSLTTAQVLKIIV